VTPNPKLQPEIVDTYELVWERQLPEGWRLTVDPYVWQMTHAIDTVTLPDDSIQPQDVGHELAYGVELEVQKKWSNGASLRAYGTATRATHEGETLTNSPAWTLGGALAIPILNRRTFIAIEPQIVGPQKSDLGQYTSPTFITNVVLTSRDILPGLEVQAGVYNLFGELARLPHNSVADHFQPTLNYPRTQFLVSLTYRF
jgi:outer membrane receptor protein involved in Fe transport